jgi:hypothetical protein
MTSEASELRREHSRGEANSRLDQALLGASAGVTQSVIASIGPEPAGGSRPGVICRALGGSSPHLRLPPRAMTTAVGPRRAMR